MTKQDNRLGAFLREVSNWNWLDFITAEHDPTYTSNQALVFALVRSCAMQNLQAIRLSTNRLDGKLATPLKIELPKVFYLYPNAKKLSTEIKTPKLEGSQIKQLEVITHIEKVEPPEPEDIATLTIRQTVAKMADYPRELPAAILATVEEIEQFYRKQGPMPSDNPAVKSVIAAHLLTMASNRGIDALGEVFDQIDGKLAETFKVLGEDIFITDYSLEAPDTAYLNDNGILQAEATQTENMWANKLAKETQ